MLVSILLYRPQELSILGSQSPDVDMVPCTLDIPQIILRTVQAYVVPASQKMAVKSTAPDGSQSICLSMHLFLCVL